MKTKAKFYLLTVAIAIVLAPYIAVAQNYGLDEAAQEAELPMKTTSLTVYAGNIIGVGLSMVSVVFFVLMLYAGVRWMIARGNEEEETKAKNTIIAAVIGMVIIMASYALTNFVFKGAMGKATKVTAPATESKPTSGKQDGAVAKKCVSKPGITEQCQKNLIKKYMASFPPLPGEKEKSDAEINGLIGENDAWLKIMCDDGENSGLCAVSESIHMCVSLGATMCPVFGNVVECNVQSDICEWK